MTPQSPQLPPGTILFGTYEITGVLGGGGMGWVYRALHRSQDSPRAIKVIRPDLVSDPAIGKLFNREAKVLLNIQHEAIVRCFDQLQDENGAVYLVMELVQGESLEEMLSDGPLNISQVIGLKRRIGQGLVATHAAGIVHRDISPGNIILPGGRVEQAKLIDFGVAAVGSVGSSAEGTIAGFKGKLAYASPEQFGLFGGKVGPASDIYSLGLVLAEAAGGRQVPMGQTLNEALEIRRSRPKLPLNIPPELLPEIEPMIQADPQHRPTSTALLSVPPREEFAPHAETSPQGVRDLAPAAPTKSGRVWAWIYSGSAIIVGLLLGCYFWIYRSPPAGNQPSSVNPASGTPAITSPQPGTPSSSPSTSPPKVAIPAPAGPLRAALPVASSPVKSADGAKAVSAKSGGITRVAMLARADEFATTTWVCGASNQKVSCARVPYHSSFLPNQSVQGVPYHWGGIDGPEDLTPKLRSGYAAGSHSWNGMLTCATGIDCSGFVCQVWGHRGKHDYSTQNLSQIADPVAGDVFANLKPGDALNLPGSHVVLFAGYQADGLPIVYEASGPASRVIRNERNTWARFQHYRALRLRNVVE